jgi:hypothetical protein
MAFGYYNRNIFSKIENMNNTSKNRLAYLAVYSLTLLILCLGLAACGSGGEPTPVMVSPA